LPVTSQPQLAQVDAVEQNSPRISGF
jgi:hypothetical protein